MSDLGDLWRRFLTHLGRPEPVVVPEQNRAMSEEHDAQVEGRLTDLERKQLEIKARLAILEKQGNPWGIGRER